MCSLSFRAERSEVENGAAGEAATWTGRPEAERTGSERIKPRCITEDFTAGSLDFAPDDGERLRLPNKGFTS